MRPAARTEPYSHAELRKMLAEGDSVKQIQGRATRFDPSLKIGALREILFGRAF